MPAAQMQALMAQQQQNMQNQQRIPNQQNPEAIRLAMQRQGMILQQQQNLLQGGGMNHNSNLAAAHLSPANTGMQNPQMLAAMAAARQNQGHMNGVGNSMGGGGNQTSPRINHVGVVGVGTGNGTLSSGHTPTINTIMQQVHQQNPTLPIEQVRTIAQDRLKSYLQRIQQQAVTAAAGNSPIANNMSMNMMGNLNMASMGGGMTNMGMMNAMSMAGMNVNGLGNMGQIPASGMSQQYQAQLQRQLAAQQQQQAQRMSAGSAAGGMSMGGMSPATAQQGGLSRSATPAQGMQMMHTRSGSGAGLDLTGSPLLQ